MFIGAAMWSVRSIVFAALMAGSAGSSSAAPGELAAEPARGSVPLTVTFVGGSGGATYFGGIEIDFGDGHRAAFCPPGRSCSSVTVVHLYSRPGNYRAQLLGNGEGQGGPSVVATVTIQAL